MKLIKKDELEGIADIFYVYKTRTTNYDIVMMVPEMQLIINEEF